MLFHHKGVQFKDFTATMDDWINGGVQAEMLMGKMPRLDIDGKKLYQSIAILRYLGRKYGYYPDDIDQQFKVDMICDSIADYRDGFSPYTTAQTNKDKNEALKKFTGEHTKKFLKFYNDILKENES